MSLGINCHLSQEKENFPREKAKKKSKLEF
jgi:hypothetical protein